MTREVDVWWLSFAPNTPSHGYWDQAMLDDLLANVLWDTGLVFIDHTEERPDCDGCVVVVPGRSHGGFEAAVSRELARYEWVLLVVTGDEERVFDWRAVTHPRMKVWVQTPRPNDHDADGFLPVGYTPHTVHSTSEVRVRNWVFMGQVTHRRRRECVMAARELPGGFLVESESFTAGLPHNEYSQRLTQAVMALCPSGPVCVDTFRVWEALEAGCVPVVDTRTPNENATWYWDMLLGKNDTPPWLWVDDWAELDGVLTEGTLQVMFHGLQVRTRAWWGRYKARLATQFARDVRDLAGIGDEPDDRITVLVATSSIPSHPATHIIGDTVASVRVELPRAHVLVMADGVRTEHEHRRAEYEQHLGVVAEWNNVTVDYVDGVWRHQAGTARHALRLVETTAILFVEHDTPLVRGDEPIPWAKMLRLIETRQARFIRFHHEAAVHPEHRWLMRHLDVQDVDGVPLLGTMQWSQRPHLASAGDYRWMLRTYFGLDARTMIEDTMHGVLDYEWREHPLTGWEMWRLWMYAPPGDIKRSTHNDGREGEDKYGMIFEYDNDSVPEGAPYPTSRRVE